MTNAQAKRWLRRALIKKRQSIGPHLQKKWGRAIVKNVLRSREFKKARVVATFIGFGSEVLTDGLIEAGWKAGKKILVPMTSAGFRNPYFVLFKKEDRLRKTSHGPWELVKKKERFNFQSIDLVLVPGLGFDRDGFRLGYGGGFYDRILEKTTSATHMGLFFSCQELACVPRHPHDKRLHHIVTERGFLFDDRS